MMIKFVAWAAVIASGIWVYRDAKSHGDSGVAWAVGTVAFWIVVFPYYLFVGRPKLIKFKAEMDAVNNDPMMGRLG